jgi:DNA-binding transcriptional MerR regulator
VTEERLYGIDELAERAGVSRRTVRYYIERGLLPPPTGLGRGKHYTDEHLATLVSIRELQERGVPLAEVVARRDAPPPAVVARPAPVQTSWSRIVLADGLELHLRGRRLDEERLRALIDAVTEVMGEEAS